MKPEMATANHEILFYYIEYLCAIAIHYIINTDIFILFGVTI